MPRYTYKCLKCNTFLEVSHSVATKPSLCSDITLCEASGSLEKQLNVLNIHHKTIRDSKVGDVVKEFIQDSRQDLDIQKQEMNKSRIEKKK